MDVEVFFRNNLGVHISLVLHKQAWNFPELSQKLAYLRFELLHKPDFLKIS